MKKLLIYLLLGMSAAGAQFGPGATTDSLTGLTNRPNVPTIPYVLLLSETGTNDGLGGWYYYRTSSNSPSAVPASDGGFWQRLLLVWREFTNAVSPGTNISLSYNTNTFKLTINAADFSSLTNLTNGVNVDGSPVTDFISGPQIYWQVAGPVATPLLTNDLSVTTIRIANLIVTNPITVDVGGTGRSNLTDQALLYGRGTNSVGLLGAYTNKIPAWTSSGQLTNIDIPTGGSTIVVTTNNLGFVARSSESITNLVPAGQVAHYEFLIPAQVLGVDGDEVEIYMSGYFLPYAGSSDNTFSWLLHWVEGATDLTGQSFPVGTFGNSSTRSAVSWRITVKRMDEDTVLISSDTSAGFTQGSPTNMLHAIINTDTEDITPDDLDEDDFTLRFYSTVDDPGGTSELVTYGYILSKKGGDDDLLNGDGSLITNLNADEVNPTAGTGLIIRSNQVPSLMVTNLDVRGTALFNDAEIANLVIQNLFGEVAVTNGGTGRPTLTSQAVLYGNGDNDVNLSLVTDETVLGWDINGTLTNFPAFHPERGDWDVEFHGDGLSDLNKGAPHVSGTAINSGTVTTTSSYVDYNHGSFVMLRSAAGAGSGWAWYSQANSLMLTNGDMAWATFILQHTNTMRLSVGFDDSSNTSTNQPTDGAIVYVDRADGLVKGMVVSNTIVTPTGTTYRPALDTWYTAGAYVRAADILLFVLSDDGTVLWSEPISTGHPIGRPTGFQFKANGDLGNLTNICVLDKISQRYGKRIRPTPGF